MIIDTSLSRLELRRGDVVRLDDAEGATVSCASGTIWVTRDRDPADIVLQGGQKARIEGPGLVLIQAFEPAQVAVATNAVFLARDAARKPARKAPVRGRMVLGGATPMPA